MHVAAVSSGNPTPYPGVNNTQRWQALAASCPYPFTILGRNEVWLGDKGVTKNKLMYYAKCGVLIAHFWTVLEILKGHKSIRGCNYVMMGGILGLSGMN